MTIEEILRNRIIDITDEYLGKKRKDGYQVYFGYPQQLIDELETLFHQVLEEENKKLMGKIEGMKVPPQQGASSYNEALSDILSLIDKNHFTDTDKMIIEENKVK